MVTEGTYCRALQSNGRPVAGWIVCDRKGRPTHLHLEARGGGRSFVYMSLDRLTGVEPGNSSEASDPLHSGSGTMPNLERNNSI